MIKTSWKLRIQCILQPRGRRRFQQDTQPSPIDGSIRFTRRIGATNNSLTYVLLAHSPHDNFWLFWGLLGPISPGQGLAFSSWRSRLAANLAMSAPIAIFALWTKRENDEIASPTSLGETDGCSCRRKLFCCGWRFCQVRLDSMEVGSYLGSG